MSTTLEVAQQLVNLCRQGKHLEAIDTLYSPDIVSIEASAGPTMPARMEGLPAIKAKSEWWLQNHTIHGGDVKGPWPHGDRFVVYFQYDITPKTGPMAGQRFTMEEAALYTVKNNKIAHEEFFYHMGA